MSDIMQRVKVFAEVGAFLRAFSSPSSGSHPLVAKFSSPLKEAIAKSKAENGWFTEDNVKYALAAWGQVLTLEHLTDWAQRYAINQQISPKKVAVIMAGNIPLVGFHDFLSVLLFGHHVVAKLSSDDKRLLPVLAAVIAEIDPELGKRISFVNKIEQPDAVIATGSNNSARYFNFYFEKYPNIIRKNRTSVAVIKETTSHEELEALGQDLFRYFGLGCRNVSKLYMPADFDINRVFKAIMNYSEVVNAHKYANNYDYYRAIFMLNKQPFLENGFVILKEHASLHTPVAVVHYERFTDEEQLRNQLVAQREELQCVVGSGIGDVPFGQTQNPALWDYADGVDTVAFLLALK